MSQPPSAPLPNKITHIKADIFAAPHNSILVHACNTRGSWGAGIAAAFQARYPGAFAKYKNTCKRDGAALLGTCLLIRGETHDVACLFTSKDYGRRVDPPAEILKATRAAVADLLKQNEVDGKELHSWYVPSCVCEGPGLDIRTVASILRNSGFRGRRRRRYLSTWARR